MFISVTAAFWRRWLGLRSAALSPSPGALLLAACKCRLTPGPSTTDIVFTQYSYNAIHSLCSPPLALYLSYYRGKIYYCRLTGSMPASGSKGFNSRSTQWRLFLGWLFSGLGGGLMTRNQCCRTVRPAPMPYSR